MSFLSKPLNKTLNSFSILTFTLRRFTSHSAAYYDELATAAGNSGDLDALRDILNKRIQDRCYNTKRTFNFITTTSSLDDLIRTLSNLNPGFTRNSAFNSLVTRLCRLERVDDALRVVETMSRDANCSITASTFHPIISLLTRERSMDHAQRVVELMSGLGVRRDLTVHNLFLMAHCFTGDMAAAAEVLKEMEEEDGLVGDTRTFDALVMGACKIGNVEGAMVLVRRMVNDGVLMLYSTHMYVIGALLEKGCLEQAVKYVKCFGGKDKVLDAEIYGCLGSKLAGMKKVKEAMKVLEEMKQTGLPMGEKLKRFYEKNVGKVAKLVY
ncbi:PREDICTED: pentatricopeptide repeat-containing protein At3g56030-like isoform X2 [Lupinus angustifolius]|uniref:pentatricopeptide repeat-containing protein At3g56030-like isoform X2 n=1 Tax=Lupinus angustifolius TaxID=3871 RepID=UPI00092EE9A9|nr:PREDICTED: pentatricopeptide repeat-containing protein At3g56030-like isoform X2 [Lupinus angustifolius]